MTSHTALGGIIRFFESIGIYDVVLPFLLVFTIVFAILEKTKVLGTVEIEGKKYPQKNLDAMAAFVMAFLVVASSKLVAIITDVSSQIVVLLLAAVFFLLLVGSFYKEGEGAFLEGRWKTLFMIIMFLGMVIIFLEAIPHRSGRPWLEWFIDYLALNWSSTAVGSIILMVLIIIFIYWITSAPGGVKEAKKE